MCQYTSVGLTCPLPSQLLYCSVILPVHCTVSSLALFLKSIFFSWEEGQVNHSIIRFLWSTIAGSRARRKKVGHPPSSGQLRRKDTVVRTVVESGVMLCRHCAKPFVRQQCFRAHEEGCVEKLASQAARVTERHLSCVQRRILLKTRRFRLQV